MEMIPDIVKIYGPLSLGWVVAAYLLKFILDRYKDDIEARVNLATALDALSKVIERCGVNGQPHV